MAKERWKRVQSGPMGLSCAVGRTFLASRLALIHGDRQHLRDPATDVENVEEYRIDLVLTQATQADLENADSLVKVNVEVSMHVRRAFCSDLQD
jgi:hypothetical protein